jgi:RNA polymerase sigma-70 factor, ECF subfamily
VQETLMKADQFREQFHGNTEGERRMWLRQILTRTLIEMHRRFHADKRNIALEQSFESQVAESSSRLEQILAANQSSPSQQAMREEELLRLADALEQMAQSWPDQCTAVKLHHLRGLAVKEVAAEMSLNVKQVGGLLYRGLINLRKLLEENPQ